MATWVRNEATAAARRCDLLGVTKNDGTLAPRGTDFIALGMVYISGVSAPDYVRAVGTLVNKRKPLAFDDKTFTADNSTDTFTAAAHGLETGDGPVRVSSSATLPDGLAAATDYWIIKSGPDTFKLASSLANAYAGTAVEISDDGTGTHTIADTTDTQRGIDGDFTYTASQAETNHSSPETTVMIDGTNYERSSGYGGATVVAMRASADELGSVELENNLTRDDAWRIMLRTLAAKFSLVSGVYQYRDMADSKDSHHGTVTSTGRTDAGIDDAT